MKIDTTATDTITTISTVTDTLTMTDTLTVTDTLTGGPTTDPPTTSFTTTFGPTSDPTFTTTFGPTSDPTFTSTFTTDPTFTTFGTDTVTSFTVTTEPPTDCGNGVVEGDEECDDGNDVDTDACPSTCKDPICGDGFVRQGFEVCDDGINDNSYEGCGTDCLTKGPFCGDSITQGDEGELCDDGNETPGDGCQGCVTENLAPECVLAEALSSPTRNVSFQTDTVACDLDIPEAGKWVRFVGSAGKKMPTSAPPEFSCGTHAPGWLNGSEPAEADGIVAREVCFNWEGDTCQFKVNIGVKHCGPFLIYNVPPVPTCALRYCGKD